jgi:putative salt-induced outer membrane protein
MMLVLAAFATRSFALEPELPPIAQLSEPSKDLFPAPVSATNRVTWKGSATVGATMTRGNSDSVVATAKLDAQRRSPVNELILGADGAYGEANGVKNYESIHGFVQDNHFFTPQFFGFLRGDGLHDGIKDIDYRYTLSPGAGYYLLKETNLNLAAEAGPSMIAEKQDGTETIYAGARLADRFEYKLNAGTRLWETTEAIPQVDQFDNFIVNAEAGIETAITKKLGLQVYMQDNYVNRPAPGYKFNDIRLVSGLTFKF